MWGNGRKGNFLGGPVRRRPEDGSRELASWDSEKEVVRFLPFRNFRLTEKAGLRRGYRGSHAVEVSVVWLWHFCKGQRAFLRTRGTSGVGASDWTWRGEQGQ